MLGRDELLRLAGIALEAAKADQVQVSLDAWDSALTRYAGNRIHQSVAETNVELQVKAVIGKNIGFAATNRIDEESLKKVARRAVEFAELAAPNPDFVSLPGPNETEPSAFPVWDEDTAQCDAETRASKVGCIIGQAADAGAVAAGSLATRGAEHVVVNSLGLRSYYRSSDAHLVVSSTKGTGNGWAERHASRVSDIDAVSAGMEAVEKSVRAENPEAIEPGVYPVVLMPYAVEDLVTTLGYMGVSAQAVQESRSWMNGRLGQRVTGENISIWDDASDPRGFVRPYDPEGVTRQRVDVISGGVAVGPVYDSFTAGRDGRKSDGHASSALGTWGPHASNLFLASGDDTLEGLLAAMGRGILVTRFHYTNVIHPIETSFTGMTRDGTFWVDGGVPVQPVKNLRFTQSILEALAHVRGAGRDLWRFNTACVPALYIDGFRFTGVTDF